MVRACWMACALVAVLSSLSVEAVPFKELLTDGENIHDRLRRSAPQLTDTLPVQTRGDADMVSSTNDLHESVRSRQKRDDKKGEETGAEKVVEDQAKEQLSSLESTVKPKQQEEEVTDHPPSARDRVKKVRDWLVKTMHSLFGGGKPGDSEGKNEGGEKAIPDHKTSTHNDHDSRGAGPEEAK